LFLIALFDTKSRGVCRVDKIYDTGVQIVATFDGIAATSGRQYHTGKAPKEEKWKLKLIFT